MKQIILTFMAAIMLANTAFAMSPAVDTIDGTRDYASVEITIPAVDDDTIVVDADEVSDWDYFWGTTVSQTLDPKLNGWDNFWFQCQDPEKDIGACVGTIFAGGGMVLAATVIVVGATILTVSAIPTAGTAAVWVQPAFGTFTTAST